MNIRRNHTVTIEKIGTIHLPPRLAQRLGLVEGARVQLEENDGSLILHRPVNLLDRVYVEPTNACNLTCVTCVRNIWEESPGWMSTDTFTRLFEGLQTWQPAPAVFFGGFGEPLAHPGLADMIDQVRTLGAPVELITNGVLLDEGLARRLLEAGLRMLWVSLDGVSQESYQDIRLGGFLGQVLANLGAFQNLRREIPGCETELGISFVAMRRNISDLPDLLNLARDLQVKKINITNLLAHTDEMRAERLYDQAQYDTRRLPEIELARLDLDEQTLQVIRHLIKSGAQISISGEKSAPAERRCPFLEKASLSMRWDGAVSPCLGLLHTHESYLGERSRKSHAYQVGNVNEKNLNELWMQTDFIQLREKLQQFDFSPCVYCNTCAMSEQNLEDCFGSRQPACGGCLWAQGLISCP